MPDECLRDIVALSTLPAIWSGADPERIAESLAASLFSMLDAEFVCIYFTGGPSGTPVAVAQTDRYETSPSLAGQLQEGILKWTALHDPEELLILPHPLETGTVHIATRSLGHQVERGVLAAAFSEPSGPTPMQQLLLNVAATQAATAIHNAHLLGALQESQERLRDSESWLRKRASQLQALAKTARLITSTLSLRDLLDSVTRAARDVIPAHQCVTSLTVSDNWAQAVQAVSLSEKYASWRQYDAVPDGSGIYSSVCRENRPFRLTQAALEAHPAWRGFGEEAPHHPRLRGWLAVPLIDADGTNMGLIQMSDKYEGDFTEDDEVLLVQLAQIASVAITNARLYETVRTSEEQSRSFAHELESLVDDRTKELVQSQDRLRALATELNLAEQRERKRLATELHDYLAQMLVLLKFKLDQAQRAGEMTPQSVELLRQAQDVLRESLTYTRTLVHDLSPPVLYEFGLPAALKWLGSRMHRHELRVVVEVLGDESVPLPEDQAVLLFQSVRELLMNSVKHAHCDKARVTLTISRDQLHIEVSDEGAGFDMAPAGSENPFPEAMTGVSSQFGLFSIRERMKAVGGSFELQSSPGKGTRAVLLLPLQSRNERITHDGHTGRSDQDRTGLPPVPTSTAKGIRVLLVDDHAMMRQGLRSVLAAYPDVDVVGEASDGEEALRMAEEYQPAVVIMDINMPKLNGIEATRLLKTHHPAMIVIGLSVNADGENEKAMKKSGAHLLLTKEAAVEHLYVAIQRVVGRTQDVSR